MKRSELAKIIADYCELGDGLCLSKDDYLNVGNTILDIVEKAGMLPPSYMRYTEQPPGNTLCAEVCEWEPENE